MKKKEMFSAFAILLCCTGSAAAGEGPDELWEVRSKTEMPGMPFPMPAQTVTVCIPKGQEKDPSKSIPQDPNQQCKMTDVKVSGNKMTWKMVCTGENPMTGNGEMEYGPGHYSGRMQMQGKQGGEPFEMATSYEGKKVGSCKYEEPKFTAPPKDGSVPGGSGEGSGDPLLDGARKMKEMFGF
ncbi:DUF3617 domain-containing protein [Thiovibrio sp. JS02]